MRTASPHVPGWLWWLLLCMGCPLIILAQGQVDARLGQPSRILDQLYFGSPEAVSRMSLGYQGLLSDLYWMRTIQYYGRREVAERRVSRYGNLAPLLKITASLDPRLLDVYHFGSTFLGEAEPLGAGKPEQALELLDIGLSHHPEQWRLYFSKGIVYFQYLKDFRRAGEVWLQGSRVAGAPEWMSGLSAKALSQGGAIETAKELWNHQLMESEREEVRENAINHLRSIEADERRWLLEFLATRYRDRFGAFPATLKELFRPDFVTRELPLEDPSGVPFVYDPARGTVEVHPETRMRYLRIEYGYRDAFMKKLESVFGHRS